MVVRYLDVSTRWLAELDAGDTRGRILAAIDRRLFLVALATKTVGDELSLLETPRLQLASVLLDVGISTLANHLVR